MVAIIDSLRSGGRYNLATLKSSPLAELSGAMGDLGTLLPLMIGLTISGSISLSSTLVFSGLFNVVTGIVFGVPLPVQPMKVITAAAIASSLPVTETVAAGSLVSLAVFVLGVTGALRWAIRWIPVPVVKGIQVGAGISLCITSGMLVQDLGWLAPSVLDNRVWAAGFFVSLLATQEMPRFPYALLIFLLGLLFAVFSIVLPDLGAGHGDGENTLPGPRIWIPDMMMPSYTGTAIGMATAQLPLTLLNSVIAVSTLSSELLPSVPPPSPTALSMSIAAMNVIGCWFGSMPMCHGSGGLAAQFRFGARSGASIIILGLLKLTVGLVFGDSLLGTFLHFPRGMLGVMVLATGLELAGVGQSLNSDYRVSVVGGENEDGNQSVLDGVRRFDGRERKRRWVVMSLTVAAYLGFKNAAVGFVAGMLCHWSYKIADWIVERRGLAVERRPLLGAR